MKNHQTVARPRGRSYAAAICTLAALALSSAMAPGAAAEEGAKAAYEKGNFADAYQAFRSRLLAGTSESAPDDLRLAVDCLGRLNRLAEADDLIEAVVQQYERDWRVLDKAAWAYGRLPNYGNLIDGEFRRGRQRGRSKTVNTSRRDRVRRMQLCLQAIQQAKQVDEQEEAARVWRQLAELTGSGAGGAWARQLLTDVTSLPPYEEGWGDGDSFNSAPANEAGEPVLYDLPNSWEAAANDGERWRWCWSQAARWNRNLRFDELAMRAKFSRNQFGVQTLGNSFRAAIDGDLSKTSSSILALHTLVDGETTAKLANGIRRFELPDDHHYLALYKKLLDETEANGDFSRAAIAAKLLADCYLDRRQFPQAAKHYRKAKSLAPRPAARNDLQRQLDQITGAWGEFESVVTQPAGQGATIGFRYRNASQVDLTAQPIDTAQLLSDVRKYLEAKPGKLDWQKLDVANIGYRILKQDLKRYVGQATATWKVDLKPAADHFDKQTTLSTPLQAAGAYWVTAKVANGNTSHIVLWVADTAIVRKPLGGQMLYFVADADTGDPLQGVTLELFGFQQVNNPRKPNDYRVETSRFAKKTSLDGTVVLDVKPEELTPEYQWLAIATNDAGRLAYLGFDGVWSAQHRSRPTDRATAYVITDRPVYRPEQTVNFKAWVQRARYGAKQEVSEFAHQAFRVKLFDAQNEEVFSETLTANAYGGIEGRYALPRRAALGRYRIVVEGQGQGSFLVEEYRKPEYEVTITAPQDSVALGDSFEARVRAVYYFGSPVTNAKVKFKVTRTARQANWYPPSPWDWLYGPGYWWFGQDMPWYPGWQQWGCWAPTPSWFDRGWEPPEIVAEGFAELDAKGEYVIPVDTAAAKELHGDSDHSYQIQAEVVDASRRTVLGSGEVLVARKPFQVFVWPDRGHYRVGDTITAQVTARRPDGQAVAGLGKLRLLQITYPDGVEALPKETEVGQWELAVSATGIAELQIKASEPGQYRVVYELADTDSRTIEGAHLFSVAGPSAEGSQFVYNDLQITPDSRDYQPGDTVKLRIDRNRTGGAVLLFLRPSSGVYPLPQLVRLDGKSTVVDVPVAVEDAPNFFIEAVTVAGGRVHRAIREIAVPPQKRMLEVEVLPSAAAFQPGQEATYKLRLTDASGEPFVGETVIAVYDKSVEYIAGGSNMEDIRKHFWGWRRTHSPGGETSLARGGGNLLASPRDRMQRLGVFGDVIPPKLGGKDRFGLARSDRSGRRRPVPGAIPMMPLAAAAEQANDGESGAGAERLVTPAVRENFADTACWVASLQTDESGIAEVSFPMPDSLSTWKARVWAMGHGARVGEGTAEVVTRKNLIVRLQTPRFLIERDEVVFSANVHNYLDAAKQVVVRLEIDGDQLQIPSLTEQTIEVPPGGDRRVDWRLTAVKQGVATVRAVALTDQESDAVQLAVPVHVHGFEKVESFSGVLAREDQLGAFEFAIPEQRRPEQTLLEVSYSPSLAGAMLEAVPYLIDYPHGCTEQTLNRFLPAVLTQQTLRKMGLDLAELQTERKALDPQRQPDGQQAWQRTQQNPVFDKEGLDQVIESGVRRLTDMQLSDGGWGWFSGYGERSTPHTTAVVVRGLLVARENDVAIVPGVLERGLGWLTRYQRQQLRSIENVDQNGKPLNPDQSHKPKADNLDALVHLVLTHAGKASDKMRDYLYRDRTRLTPYSLAMLGVALHGEGDQVDKRDAVIRNLSQFLVTDQENQTAYLNLPGDGWWYWHGSEFETQAYFLKLLALTEPDGDTAAGLVKYLLTNRRHATYWNSTRDTALVIEAMADYLQATGEGRQQLTVEVWLDGQRRKEVVIDADNLLTFDSRFALSGLDLQPGRHTLELRKQGSGRLYWSGRLANFTMEDDLRAAGLDVRVQRKLYKLAPSRQQAAVAGARGQVVRKTVQGFERLPITNLASVESGDIVQVELTLTSKNDFEYLVVTDHKPAGFEPVDLRSGYTGNELGAYVEYRDAEVNLYLRRLARGQRSVSYQLRAEAPGKFSALPTEISAMYAPELRGNSDEIKVRVQSAPVSDETEVATPAR